MLWCFKIKIIHLLEIKILHLVLKSKTLSDCLLSDLVSKILTFLGSVCATIGPLDRPHQIL